MNVTFPRRNEIIDHVLNDLQTLKKDKNFHNIYALEENIAFFEAIKSFSGYLSWLIKRAPKLERLKLLELTDFPFPKWDRMLHENLVMMEKKKFPDMIGPLRDVIVKFVIENKPKFLMDFGFGGMEVALQVIKELQGNNYRDDLVRGFVSNHMVKKANCC